MADWRDHLQALASVSTSELFPLLVYKVNPPSDEAWPSELADPSQSLQGVYQICDGGVLGGYHSWFSVGELLEQNRNWWERQAEYGPGPIDPDRHVIVAYETSGFPIVWDQRTDQLLVYFFKDGNELERTGPTIDEFMIDLFSPQYEDESWQEALEQLRDLFPELRSDGPVTPTTP